jgi:transcriptional regulator with XRE-family HTH domain
MFEADVRKIILERIEQGLTYRDLEEKSNVTASAIAKIERGETKPRLVTVAKIAKGLGKEIEYFEVENK